MRLPANIMTEEILVCAPVNTLNNHMAGSFQAECFKCGALVWVSPSSVLILDSHPGMPIICTECGFKKVLAEDGEIMPLTPTQIEELKRYLRGQL